MAKVITSYEASDGTKFDSALGADAHDLSLQKAESIGAYAAAARLGPAEATRAKKYISGYAAFMAAEAASQAG